ncbi:4780_t:CDS:1, partial [Rhizophagus irregularis]
VLRRLSSAVPILLYKLRKSSEFTSILETLNCKVMRGSRERPSSRDSGEVNSIISFFN